MRLTLKERHHHHHRRRQMEVLEVLWGCLCCPKFCTLSLSSKLASFLSTIAFLSVVGERVFYLSHFKMTLKPTFETKLTENGCPVLRRSTLVSQWFILADDAISRKKYVMLFNFVLVLC